MGCSQEKLRRGQMELGAQAEWTAMGKAPTALFSSRWVCCPRGRRLPGGRELHLPGPPETRPEPNCGRPHEVLSRHAWPTCPAHKETEAISYPRCGGGAQTSGGHWWRAGATEWGTGRGSVHTMPHCLPPRGTCTPSPSTGQRPRTHRALGVGIHGPTGFLPCQLPHVAVDVGAEAVGLVEGTAPAGAAALELRRAGVHGQAAVLGPGQPGHCLGARTLLPVLSGLRLLFPLGFDRLLRPESHLKVTP